MVDAIYYKRVRSNQGKGNSGRGNGGLMEDARCIKLESKGRSRSDKVNGDIVNFKT